jgi:hypothetical protein
MTAWPDMNGGPMPPQRRSQFPERYQAEREAGECMRDKTLRIRHRCVSVFIGGSIAVACRCFHRHFYLFFHTGGRFSLNALMPSCRSSENTGLW